MLTIFKESEIDLPPRTGFWRKGTTLMDKSGRVWTCVKEGIPGTWQKVAFYNDIGGGGGSCTETDPIWTSEKSNYYTKTQVDGMVHTHTNKSILDGITNTGSGTLFLSDDGTYRAAGSSSEKNPSVVMFEADFDENNALWEFAQYYEGNGRFVATDYGYGCVKLRCNNINSTNGVALLTPGNSTPPVIDTRYDWKNAEMTAIFKMAIVSDWYYWMFPVFGFYHNLTDHVLFGLNSVIKNDGSLGNGKVNIIQNGSVVTYSSDVLVNDKTYIFKLTFNSTGDKVNLYGGEFTRGMTTLPTIFSNVSISVPGSLYVPVFGMFGMHMIYGEVDTYWDYFSFKAERNDIYAW